MHLAKYCKLSKTGEPPRMIVRRDIPGTQFDLCGRSFERFQNVFDVPFEIKEREVSWSFMHALGSYRTRRRKNQCAAFAILAIHLAEFEELEIMNTAIQIPMQRLEYSRNQGSPQYCRILGHGILEPDRFDIRTISPFGFFIAEGVSDDLAVPAV